MRYFLLLVVLLFTGCQAGFDTRLQQPQQQQYAPPTPYQFRYDPYTGQQLRQ